MARLVVNKHADKKDSVSKGDFISKGEIIISNETGKEGIYIVNNQGEIKFISKADGYATEPWVMEWIEKQGFAKKIDRAPVVKVMSESAYESLSAITEDVFYALYEDEEPE